jgi:hypothetical protein
VGVSPVTTTGSCCRFRLTAPKQQIRLTALRASGGQSHVTSVRCGPDRECESSGSIARREGQYAPPPGLSWTAAAAEPLLPRTSEVAVASTGPGEGSANRERPSPHRRGRLTSHVTAVRRDHGNAHEGLADRSNRHFVRFRLRTSRRRRGRAGSLCGPLTRSEVRSHNSRHRTRPDRGTRPARRRRAAR